MTGKLQHKFHAVRSERDGIKFPSKKEAAFYDKLKFLQKNGQVLFFLRQVPFSLPGNVIYRADFMVFWVNGTVSVIDVKGYITNEYKIKKKLVESIYPIKIEEE